MSAALITPEYQAMQREMHATMPHYGIASVEHAPTVANVITEMGVRSMIDYGCGKGRLGAALAKLLPAGVSLEGQFYDPGVERFAAEPEPAELVACIDVIEHVEPESTGAVLDHIQRLAMRVVVLTIHLGPAAKTLPDGRNAHINLRAPEDWMNDWIVPRWDVLEASIDGATLIVIAEPKNADVW